MDRYELKILTGYQPIVDCETSRGRNFSKKYNPYTLYCVKSKLNMLLKNLLDDAYISWCTSTSLGENGHMLLAIYNIDGSVKLGSKSDLMLMESCLKAAETIHSDYILYNTMINLTDIVRVNQDWLEDMVLYLLNIGIKKLLKSYEVDNLSNYDVQKITYLEEETIFIKLGHIDYIYQLEQIDILLFKLLKSYYSNGYITKRFLLTHTDLDYDAFMNTFNFVDRDGLLIPMWYSTFITYNIIAFIKAIRYDNIIKIINIGDRGTINKLNTAENIKVVNVDKYYITIQIQNICDLLKI